VLPPPDDYAELVLDVVATIPEGRVSTYGRVAAAVRETTGRGSARVVGRVMALYGGEVCWWRVVTASGALAERVAAEQLRRLREEDVPMTGDPPRVDLRRAAFDPSPPAPLPDEPGQM
jgi:methylated-DNA-protein-cysteine methyltransferase related protein